MTGKTIVSVLTKIQDGGRQYSVTAGKRVVGVQAAVKAGHRMWITGTSRLGKGGGAGDMGGVRQSGSFRMSKAGHQYSHILCSWQNGQHWPP